MESNEAEVREYLIRTPTWHSPKQKIIMNAFDYRGVEEIWVAMGTKFGKTVGAGACMVSAAPIREQALFRWIAPIYSQSTIGYNYIRRMLPSDDPSIVKLNHSDPSIYFPQQDTRIAFCHGQHPETLEGEATAGNILDEAAKMKEDVYAAVKTTTTVTRGPIMGISTPFGKNWFYHKCMQAKDEMLRARREGRTPRMLFLTAPSSCNPAILADVIEQARKLLPDRLFRQYYLAEFVDNGSVFTFLFEAFDKATVFATDQFWMTGSHDSKRIFGGVDWAKTNDYTVFTALNEQGKEIAYKRFQKVSYPEQVASMYAFFGELKSRSSNKDCGVEILHDQTGIGEVIEDIIKETKDPTGYDITGIVWNNTNKEKAVNKLILSFEEQCLHLFPWDTRKEELSSFELKVTPSGKPKYAAPHGLHDDSVMSLVTANMLYREGKGKKFEVGIVDMLERYRRKLHMNGGVIDDD